MRLWVCMFTRVCEKRKIVATSVIGFCESKMSSVIERESPQVLYRVWELLSIVMCYVRINIVKVITD